VGFPQSGKKREKPVPEKFFQAADEAANHIWEKILRG
jgi:hypothetical protein